MTFCALHAAIAADSYWATPVGELVVIVAAMMRRTSVAVRHHHSQLAFSHQCDLLPVGESDVREHDIPNVLASALL